VNVRRVEAEQAAVRRRRDALALALESAYADLVSTTQRERAAWLKELEAEFAAARARYDVAIKELAATRTEYLRIGSVIGWQAGFPEQPVYTFNPPWVYKLAMSWEHVMDALRFEVEQ